MSTLTSSKVLCMVLHDLKQIRRALQLLNAVASYLKYVLILINVEGK